MPPISAVVTTFNSDATLAPVLAALSWCDEILVVDSGSSDATLDICRQHGCRVIHHDFAGYGRQKHFAVNCAAHDWVLVVDSDEIVTPALRDEILGLLRDGDPPQAGFMLAISLVFLGRLLRFGGEYGKLHLRFFDRRRGNYNFDDVHERVEVDGAVGTLRERMLHDSYRDLGHYFEKFNRYTSRAAEEMQRRGRRASSWYVALRMPLSFVHLYFIKGLLLDGYPGFVWALLSALSPTVKYMKLRELQMRAKPRAAQQPAQSSASQAAPANVDAAASSPIPHAARKSAVRAAAALSDGGKQP